MLLTPLPLSQTVTPSRTPSPIERDVLYGWPLSSKIYLLFRNCKGHYMVSCSLIVACALRHETPLQYPWHPCYSREHPLIGSRPGCAIKMVDCSYHFGTVRLHMNSFRPIFVYLAALLRQRYESHYLSKEL